MLISKRPRIKRRTYGPLGWNPDISTVLVFGSPSIDVLPSRFIRVLNELKNKNYRILIGDSPGVDRLVQLYFCKENHFNVVVYSVCEEPEFIAPDRFSFRRIHTAYGIPEQEAKAIKFKIMCREGDQSVVLWDQKNQDTYSNIIQYIDSGKTVQVFTMRKGKGNCVKMTSKSITGLYHKYLKETNRCLTG